MKKDLELEYICQDCLSITLYGRGAECQHEDFHVVSVSLSGQPCEYCLRVFNALTEEDIKGPLMVNIEDIIEMSPELKDEL